MTELRAISAIVSFGLDRAERRVKERAGIYQVAGRWDRLGGEILFFRRDHIRTDKSTGVSTSVWRKRPSLIVRVPA